MTKKLQKIIDSTDNKVLDGFRIIFVLTLILVFGIVFYRFAIIFAPSRASLLAETQVAAFNQMPIRNIAQQPMKPDNYDSDEHTNGGDISIEVPRQNSSGEPANRNFDIEENSFYADASNVIVPMTILKDNSEQVISSELFSDFSAKSIIVVNAPDGTVLAKKDIDKKLPIASVTKLMTALAVSENLAADEKIAISQKSIEADGEVGKLIAGEEFTVIDLLKIMLIASSNDAAEAFAEHFAKKSMNLMDAMNEKAKLLGMSNTHFANPSGLDAKDHYSTAADLARLGAYIAGNPTIRGIISQKFAKIYSINTNTAHTVISTNHLLHQNVPEIIGGKTGYTVIARGCILSLLNIGGQEMVAVVLGSEDRFEETKQLIVLLENQKSKQQLNFQLF